MAEKIKTNEQDPLTNVEKGEDEVSSIHSSVIDAQKAVIEEKAELKSLVHIDKNIYFTKKQVEDVAKFKEAIRSENVGKPQLSELLLNIENIEDKELLAQAILAINDPIGQKLLHAAVEAPLSLSIGEVVEEGEATTALYLYLLETMGLLESIWVGAERKFVITQLGKEMDAVIQKSATKVEFVFEGEVSGAEAFLNSTTCLGCDGKLNIPPDTSIGEITTCPDCGESFEITSKEECVYAIKKAEKVAEDWGE